MWILIVLVGVLAAVAVAVAGEATNLRAGQAAAVENSVEQIKGHNQHKSKAARFAFDIK